MNTSRIIVIICSIFLMSSPLCAQDDIIETVHQAEEYLALQNYNEAAELLKRSLEMVNFHLLNELESTLPEAGNGWRAEDSKSDKIDLSAMLKLKVKKSYFEKGGGSSVDIRVETNSLKISNIRTLFTSPSRLNRVDEKMKISNVNDRRCLEKYDGIDRYAELIFVPGSSIMVTIIGQDVSNIKIIKKYAEKIDWNKLELLFP